MMARILGAVAVLVLGAAAGRADVILSLVPDQPLASLNVGDTVTFSVNVQLTGGENLDLLTTKVLFTTGIFSLTTPVAPPPGSGGVVPDPVSDFIGTTNVNTSPPGFDDADGSFLLPVGGNITTSGVFFTFQATLLQGGTAFIGFDPASTQANDAMGGPVTPTIPAPEVVPLGPAGVPEPGSLLAWVLACGAAVGTAWRHRRGGRGGRGNGGRSA